MDSKSALQQLQNYQGTQKSGNQIYEQTSQQLGLPQAQNRQTELRDVIRGTEQALRGVEGSVTGRTQGSLVTEAQRSRLANLERAPLSDTFREQQGALSDEEALYQRLLGEAGTRSGLEYQSQSDKLKSLQYGYEQSREREQASQAQRQAALEQRNWERTFAENARQFNSQLAASKAKQASSNVDIAKILASLREPAQSKPAVKATDLARKGIFVAGLSPEFYNSIGMGVKRPQVAGGGW